MSNDQVYSGKEDKTSGRLSHGRRGSMVRTARAKRAFIDSTALRSMAEHLATDRTPKTYAAVAAFGREHTGDAAATAYLALGHAYLIDHAYSRAIENFRRARMESAELDDVADFLTALANHHAGNNAGAEELLHGFARRYPDSIFVDQTPELEGTVLLALNYPEKALAVLAEAANTHAAVRVGYELAKGQVELAMGAKQEAIETFKQVLLEHPLSEEAQSALARLMELDSESTLTVAQLRSIGDAYYSTGRCESGTKEYQALLVRDSELTTAERNGFIVAEATCELKIHKLTPARVQALPDTDDENGAQRLYLLMELAQERGDTGDQQHIISEMETRFPRSQWLAEALFSIGNTYLVKRDYPNAVLYYSYLADHFPNHRRAAVAQWRTGWLSYRQEKYTLAAELFDEQIKLYPGTAEAVSALYWRGRLYESQEGSPSKAAANYRAIVRVYPQYFYAQLAKKRLAALGKLGPAPLSEHGIFHAAPEPQFVNPFPSRSSHLPKARLLADAGLDEYVALEIKADHNSASESALAEAKIYASYGETYRALRAAKRALPHAFAMPISAIPLEYWRLLFPEPYWKTIKTESAKNDLNPYFVASLIRQETEFNPSAISYKGAYGLMQVRPSVGRVMAREEGIRHFETFQLLDPYMNIRLGCRYLRQMLDKFGGVKEYALAAYDAGGTRAVLWESGGPYLGMDEFVESIPFTETREYVEAILRNEEIYGAIDEFAQSREAVPKSASQ